MCCEIIEGDTFFWCKPTDIDVIIEENKLKAIKGNGIVIKRDSYSDSKKDSCNDTKKVKFGKIRIRKRK